MRKPGLPIAALGAAALLYTAGCASQTDVQTLNQNEQTLRSMIATDRQQVDSLAQQLREVKDQVSEIQHGAAATTGANDPLNAINDRLGRLESEVNAMQVGMANSPNPGLPSSVGSSSPGVPGPGPVASAGTCPPPPPPTWPTELDSEMSDAQSSSEPGAKQYRTLLQAMKDQKYSAVLVQWNLLQRKYPKSSLIEPAEYFTANALFEMKQYGRSILQFNDLVLRYPKGKYASQSLLRQAEAFLNNGNDQLDAKLTLDTLINKHPDAPEVADAKKMRGCIAG